MCFYFTSYRLFLYCCLNIWANWSCPFLHHPQVFYLLQSRSVQTWSPWQWMMTFASWSTRRPTRLLERAPCPCVLAMNLLLLILPWSLPTRTSRRGCETPSEKTPCWGGEWNSWRIRYRCKQARNGAVGHGWDRRKRRIRIEEHATLITVRINQRAKFRECMRQWWMKR